MVTDAAGMHARICQAQGSVSVGIILDGRSLTIFGLDGREVSLRDHPPVVVTPLFVGDKSDWWDFYRYF